MQQNGQEQQEQRHVQQAAGQQEQEGEPNAATVSAQLEQRLNAEQQKAQECLDLLQRTQADFVNYRPDFLTSPARDTHRVVSLCQVGRELQWLLSDPLGTDPPGSNSHPSEEHP